jgi:hypothetical protein
MPDNRLPGALEDFLHFLVPLGDALFEYAKQWISIVMGRFRFGPNIITTESNRRPRISFAIDTQILISDAVKTHPQHCGREGVWFLANPITGKPAFNGEKNELFPNGETWRTEESVTAWRYMVIESDEAPEHLWLRMLVQLHLPIVAIYTSGGESVHAVVRVDQPTKAAWDQFRESIKREFQARVGRARSRSRQPNRSSAHPIT